MLTGIVLACMTFAGLVILFLELPPWLQKWLRRHPFITDATSSYMAWAALSSISQSVASAIGAMLVGLLIGIALAITGEEDG